MISMQGARFKWMAQAPRRRANGVKRAGAACRRRVTASGPSNDPHSGTPPSRQKVWFAERFGLPPVRSGSGDGIL